MADSRERDFMFCDLCGTLLSFSSKKHVECPLCKFNRDVKEISRKEISYTVTAEDIRRELGISTFGEVVLQSARTNRKCEKCGNNEATYYNRQMRSADEGETTFYECTKCGHKTQEN